MKKRGRINKTWTTRLFVLKGPLLTYYEAEQHPSIKVIARKGAVSVLNVHGPYRLSGKRKDFHVFLPAKQSPCEK